MASYSKFNQFVEDLAVGVHDCGTDQFTVGLTTNANAPAATNEILANITEISYTNLSSRNLTTSTASQTSGTYTQLFADLTLTASGAVATFRHVFIYNNTPTTPEKISVMTITVISARVPIRRLAERKLCSVTSRNSRREGSSWVKACTV